MTTSETYALKTKIHVPYDFVQNLDAMTLTKAG
jgi:hypothetical protein